MRNDEKRWETMRNNEKHWETMRNGEKRWETMGNNEKATVRSVPFESNKDFCSPWKERREQVLERVCWSMDIQSCSTAKTSTGSGQWSQEEGQML